MVGDPLLGPAGFSGDHANGDRYGHPTDPQAGVTAADPGFMGRYGRER